MRRRNRRHSNSLRRSRLARCGSALAAAACMVVSLAVAVPAVAATPSEHRVLNVLQTPFSAPADGTSNDTPAVQAALDAARGTGDTVLLPAGHTFVLSNVTVSSDMTLRIDGDVRQATDVSYYPTPPFVGDRIPGVGGPGEYPLDTGFVNEPLISAHHASHVQVTGSGTITMQTGATFTDPATCIFCTVGDDSHTIRLDPIGFDDVKHFDISGLTIHNATFWNLVVAQSNYGRIHDVTIGGVQHINNDGLDIVNSQDVDVFNNNWNTWDDSVVVRSEGPGQLELIAENHGLTMWRDTFPPQPTKNIDVHDNTMDSACCGVDIIPWTWGGGMDGKNLQELQISNVNIHDNTITGGNVALPHIGPVSCVCNVIDTAKGFQGYTTAAGVHSPVKDVTIMHNRITTDVSSSTWGIRSLSSITGLRTDIPSLLVPSSGQLSWPGDAAYAAAGGSFSAPLLDGDFELASAPVYWDTSGSAGTADAATLARLSNPQTRAAAAHVAPGWGRFGYLQSEPGRGASLSQDLGLAGADVLGSAGATYTLTFNAVTAASGATVYAYNTCTKSVIASRHIASSTAQSVRFSFPVTSTCANVTVGVKVNPGAQNWALVDQFHLKDSVVQPVVIDDNDPSISYSGSWAVDTNTRYLGTGVHYATAAGSSVTIPWHGGRAKVIALESADYETGSATVTLDGADKGIVSWYRAAGTAYQQVLYDTGDLPIGDHTLTFTMTGDAPDAPTVVRNYINIDALEVLPYPGEVPPVQTIEDADPSVSYAGSWHAEASGLYSGGSTHYAVTAGSSVTIGWTGGQAQVIARVDNDYETGSAQVTVDGAGAGAVSWYHEAGRLYQQVVFDTGPLPVGSHTITLTMTGDRPGAPTVIDNYINFDALRVLVSPPIIQNPIVVDDAVSTTQATPASVNVLANDTDPNGDALAISSVGQGSHGHVVIVGQQVVYTPAPGFVGTDSFDYTVDDSSGGAATGTVNVTVH